MTSCCEGCRYRSSTGCTHAIAWWRVFVVSIVIDCRYRRDSE